MAEQIDLTTPDFADPRTTTHYRVAVLQLSMAQQRLVIVLEGENNVTKTFHYRDQEAVDMMIFLNKANLSVKSLHRRVLEKLIADGHIEGSISGTPD